MTERIELNMMLIIGVRFRKSRKVYYFDPTGFSVKKGDHVIVETVRGIEYGQVALGPKEIAEDKVVSPLKPIMRVATPKDDEIDAENQTKEKEAYKICLEKIDKHGLEMKLIDSEYTFDRNKLLFYFTADGRIDFRELVKDLASVFRTRIELRQIGVRDETKMIGGIAICGRPLCCHSYLSDFAPVSIKMAKEQNLSLNPSKISGACGRLMCCLKNEQEAYEHLNSTLPSIGARVKTADGYQGEVQNISVLKQMVKVIISKENGDKEVREYPVSDLSFDNRHRGHSAISSVPFADEEIDEKELEQLQIMEKEDLEDLAEDAENAGDYPSRKPESQRNDSNRRERDRNDSYRNRKGRNNYPKGDSPRYDRSRSDNYSKSDSTRNERGRNEHSRGDYDRGERSRGDKNYRNSNKKIKDHNYSSKRPHTHRKNPNPRDRSQEESKD